MKPFLRVTVLVLLCVSASRGQDTTDLATPFSFHVLGITIGVNQAKEENLVPRVHTGFITRLSYEYRRIGEQSHDFRCALGLSRILADPEDITKTANAMITSSYSYSFKVIDESSLMYFIGPQADLVYSVFFYPNWDDSHLYWGNSLSLGISNSALFSFQNDTRLFARFFFSLLSVSSRPDLLRLYKFEEVSFDGIVKNVHSDLTLGVPPKVMALHFDIEYQFPLFQTKTEAVFYSFDYARINSDPALPFTQMIHQLGLRILL